MLRRFLTILLFNTIKISIAQTLYKTPLYSEVNKTTHTYFSKNNKTLQLDYYRAEKSQQLAPLVVYVHGGGFSGGKRDEVEFVNFATKLAKRGYAVASVSYQLTMKGIGFGCNVSADKKVDAINTASNDVNVAVNYILENNGKFKIEPTKIILSGSSAGAETVLNMVYTYKDSVLPPDFSYAGVIGMAGAITSLSNINEHSAIPTQLFHGTGDRLVPYNIAPHHYCTPDSKGYLTLYGSKAIAKRLSGLGTSYYLYTVEGGSHDWASLPITQCFDEIIDFLFNDIVMEKSKRQTIRTITSN
ncbi:Acetyl esterase/lipase [Tenacibaculum sp. MAR_2009_124]|uniref:alpha/beta hydrolase n=1 Tax=Tenacibaculum sp. MAR_2009_124 TaxID=1250059 RepID=UPI00089D3C52|nr:alpha/beta hydrolase [Tenacibaculum sp. MAR_2009_124]SED06418.1 Acetyl esterase/lipase [Tenacibaculum sp. MAR_2009_124]